mmetsp:Transcript_35309/g.91785  ORF Transcript_35309/g.91785 Transcript_35309/m.91785 type:complete len:201 (-) Transcript_35309:1040-1642(-)
MLKVHNDSQWDPRIFATDASITTPSSSITSCVIRALHVVTVIGKHLIVGPAHVPSSARKHSPPVRPPSVHLGLHLKSFPSKVLCFTSSTPPHFDASPTKVKLNSSPSTSPLITSNVSVSPIMISRPGWSAGDCPSSTSPAVTFVLPSAGRDTPSTVKATVAVMLIVGEDPHKGLQWSPSQQVKPDRDGNGGGKRAFCGGV